MSPSTSSPFPRTTCTALRPTSDRPRRMAPPDARSGVSARRSWPTGPHLFDLLEGSTDVVDPLFLVAPYQSHAPGQRLAPAPGYARVDQGVEYLALGDPEPGHDRCTHRREVDGGVTARGAPGHESPERGLRLIGDPHALLAGVLAEPTDSGGLGHGLIVRAHILVQGNRIEGQDNQDLVVVDGDDRRAVLPVLGKSAGEPRHHPPSIGRGGPFGAPRGTAPSSTSDLAWSASAPASCIFCLFISHDY